LSGVTAPLLGGGLEAVIANDAPGICHQSLVMPCALKACCQKNSVCPVHALVKVTFTVSVSV